MTTPDLPTEALEAAARAELLALVSTITTHTVGCTCFRCDDLTVAAPHLIAEGRRQAAADIRALDVGRIENLDGDSTRVGLTVAANIAEHGHGS